MKIVARMPLLVRGQPKRNNGPRDIFVVNEVPWEIPEVSISEMSEAFSTRETFRRVAHGMNGPTTNYRMDRFRSDFVLMEYGGELYTKIAERGRDHRALFQTAFPVSWERNYHGEDYEISFDSVMADGGRSGRGSAISPVSYAVYKQLAWHQACRWVTDQDPTYTWPVSSKPRPDGIEYIGNNGRNHATFEDVLPEVVEFDRDQYAACMEMYPRQLSRLLLADGELWMKTPPPVYRVRPFYETQKTSALVHICLAPDRHDTKVSDAIFALSAREEAIEFAQRLADFSARDRPRHDLDARGERGNVYDTTVACEIPDDRLVNYDHQTEEVRRFSCALAAENRRFVCRNPEWAAKRNFTDADVRSIHASFDQVMATNYVNEEYGDASPWLESNFAFFKRAGRKHSQYEFGRVAHSDLLMERVRRYDENRPIHFGLSELNSNPTAGF